MIPAKPPNEILQSVLGIRENIEKITDADIQSLGKQCNLIIEEIKLSLEHFRQVEINRKRGTEKAKEARRKKALQKQSTKH